MRRTMLLLFTAATIGLGALSARAEAPPKPPKPPKMPKPTVVKAGKSKSKRPSPMPPARVAKPGRPGKRSPRQPRQRRPRPVEMGREERVHHMRERIEREIGQINEARERVAKKHGEDHPQVRAMSERIEQLERHLRELEHRGHPGPGEFVSSGLRRARPPSPELMEKLGKKIPELEFPKVPFEEIIDYLRGFHKINIYVEWPVLAEMEIDRETPVTVEKLSDVPLETAVGLILRGTQTEEPGELAYYVDGNVLVITSQDQMRLRGPLPPEVNAMMQRLRHERPELYERFMLLAQRNPDAFHKELIDLGPFPHGDDPRERRGRFMGMDPREREMAMAAAERDRPGERDPELLELMKRDERMTDRSIELAERIRRTEKDEAKEDLRNGLRKLLNEQFDVRMELHRHEAKELERHIDELLKGLEKRAKNRGQLIERRMDELLNPEETQW